MRVFGLYNSMGIEGEERIYEILKDKRGPAHAEYAAGYVLYRMHMNAAGDDRYRLSSVSHLENAVGLDENNIRARYYLGMSYFWFDRLAEARAELRRVIESNVKGNVRHETTKTLAIIKALDQFDSKQMLEGVKGQ